MNKILKYFLMLLLGFAGRAFGQNREAVEVTPKVLQQIKAEVEKEVIAYKQKLIQKDHEDNAAWIEFSVDTFRIEKVQEKRMDIDFTTVGMNNATYAKADDYDKLMNKYYNRLLKLLKPADKMVLIHAQRAWVGYRDAETKLLYKITGEYSGGGTIQTNIAAADYADMIVKRTEDIFQYYDSVTNKM